MTPTRRLKILNALLFIACVGLACALWRRSPRPPQPESLLARHVHPMTFDHAPLSECFNRLAASTGVTLAPDWGQLGNLGAFKDVQTSATIGDLSLADALCTLFNDLPANVRPQVKFAQRDGVVYIGDDVLSEIVIRAYDLTWIHQIPGVAASPPPGSPPIGGGLFGGAAVSSDPQIARLVEVLASGLDTRDTNHTREFVPYLVGDRLIIRASIERHHEIDRYLTEVRAAAEKPFQSHPISTNEGAEALRHQTVPPLRFQNKSFADVVVTLQRATGHLIVVKWDRLRLFSDVTPQSQVTFDTTGLELGRTLNAILYTLNGDANPMRCLSWCVEDHRIVISLESELLYLRETRAYPVNDLLHLVPAPALTPNAGQREPDSPTEDRLLELIRTHLHDLDPAKPPPTLSYWNGLLVATCRPEAHDAIAQFVKNLRHPQPPE